jgi:hypothetical protein
MLQQNKGCSSFCGPVAQLGARFHGMEEVIGSIPIRSTNPFNNLDHPNLQVRSVCATNVSWRFQDARRFRNLPADARIDLASPS